MKSFDEFLVETTDGSNKTKAMSELVSALKKVFNDYDIYTRKFVWTHLNSPKGKELVEKLLRNPKTALSDSEFTKLVQTQKK